MNERIFDNCFLINFPKIGDNQRGFLTVFEENKQIPFTIKRVYYIYGIGNLSEIRGPHAHKRTDQVFINIQGKATYHVDNGIEKREITLNKPNVGIFIGSKLWHYMSDFSEDIIFLVVASTYYDDNDYMRGYDDFTDYLKQNP